MKRGIVLLGPPGVGKSYWGKAIAKHLQIPFFDLDRLVENETKLTIHEIFEEGGEILFRQIETSILLQLHENQINEEFVLAVGGGTPAYNNNMSIISEMGTSIYLKGAIEQIIKRLKSDEINHRPLVKNTNSDSLYVYLEKLILEREPFYLMADYMLFDNELNIMNFIKVINDKTND